MDSGGLGSASGSIELDAAKALAALTQVSTGLRNLDSQSRSQGGGLLDWANKNEQSLKTIGTGLTGVGVAITGAFGLATKVTMDFDAQISAVGSVAGASQEQLGALREEALRLGADTTLGATEAAAAMEIMLKAGASLESVLNGGAEAAINLSEATGVDITLAAETAATAMNIFKTDAKTAADTIAQSANASALDVNDWALALKAAGPIAKSLGLDMEDLAQGMVILGDAGIKGETGGTALRNILMGLADPAGDAALYLNDLGVATHDAQGNFRGLEEVTHDLAGAWGEMDAAQKLQIATMVAGEQGAASWIAIMDAQAEAARNGGDAFQNASTRMDDTGTASEQAAARMDNLKGSFEQLKGTIETLMITFTSGLAPGMRVVVDALNSVLQGVLALPAPVKTVIAALTGIAGAAALGAGGFLLLLPRIAETRNALQDLSKAPGIIGRISSSILGLGTSSTGAAAGVGGLRGSLMGLAKAHPALMGLGLIAGGLYAAYRTNFLGIGDLVDGMAGKVKSVFSDMSAAFNASGESAGVAAEDVAAFAEATHVADGKTVYTAFVTNADGTKREVGEIIESVANADGKTAQVLIQGDDGQYWATIDLATGEISNAEIPVTANTKPFSERLNDALQVLEDRFDEAGMGFAASIVDNLQGVVKSVASMGNKLKTVFTALSPRVKDFLSKIATAAVVLAPLGAGLGLIAKAASTLSPVLTVARVAIQGVGLAIAVLTSPIGLVVAGIAALVAGAIYAYQNFETFRNIVDSVAGTLRDFATNAIEKVVEAWNTLKASFDADGWSGVWDTIVQAVQDGLQSILDAITGIDWAGVLQASWDALQGASDWLLGKLGDLSGALWSWFSGAVSGVNWGNVLSTAWDALLGAAGWILDKIVAGVSLLDDLAAWFLGVVGEVQWASVFTTAIDALSGAAGWILDKITGGISLGFRIWQWFWDAVSGIQWKSVFDLAIDALKNAGQWIVDKVQVGAAAAYAGVKSWAEGIWKAITDALQPVIDKAIDVVNSLISGLNKIPGVDISPITTQVQDLGTAIGAVNGASLESVLAQIRNVQAAAGTAESATTKLMRALRGGTLSTHPKMDPGDASPAPVPEPGQPLPTPTYEDGQLPIGGLSGMPVIFDNIASAAGRAATAILPVNTNVAAIAGQSAAVTAFGGAATSAFLTSGSAAQTGLSPISPLVAAMAAGLTGAAIPAFVGIQASAATNFASMLSAVSSNTASASSTAGTNASSMNAKVAGEMAGMQVKSAAQMVLLAASAASNFSTMQTAATTAGSRMAQEMTNGATRALSGVRSALSQIPGIVSSIGGSAAGAARSVGANIGSSMASGMESALGRIRAAANAMVAAAETALRARAMIASPSRLFKRLGEYTGEGYALGITRMSRDVAASGRDLVNALLQSLHGVTAGSLIPALEAATGSPQPIGRRLTDTLTGIANGMVTDSLIPALQQAVNASQLSGYGRSVTPVYATAPAAPVVTHVTHSPVHVYALKSDELIHLMQQAERGGTYAKTMSQNDAFTQYLGGS